MLVLTRKQGETIHVGEAITIIVKRIDGGRVRIGICAPNHTAIVRGELHQEASAQRANVCRAVSLPVDGVSDRLP
jgi:carbon storage regulator CsrA